MDEKGWDQMLDICLGGMTWDKRGGGGDNLY